LIARAICGGGHVLKSAGRRVGAPPDDRSRKALCNRFSSPDAPCRPIAFMLTGGRFADCMAGAALLERLAPWRIGRAVLETWDAQEIDELMRLMRKFATAVQDRHLS
jgi:hypothetical protein